MVAANARRSAKTSITFEIQEQAKYLVMKELVPLNCIVGSEELVPGLVADKLNLS